MKKTQIYAQEHKQVFLDELFAWLKIPSISADAAYKKDVLHAAEFIKNKLQSVGADKAQVIATAGNPVVYAEKIINPALPTILVYGHYDVQPVVPLELWESPPFEPTIRKTDIHPEGAIFARGATDDKGQTFMHVAAFEAMHQTGELPCNVKFLLEGEEEVGSESLGTFVQNNQDLLKADVVLISDSSMMGKNEPSVCVGLRGILAVEITVKGAKRDLHSGFFGGAVTNPLNALCEMVASLKDENQKITIPGFYDQVHIYSDAERAEINALPFDAEEYKKSIGVNGLRGEKGYSVFEQTATRPTLDLNGIWGGYQGEGSKTIIPSEAHAKITMRLVPGQDPHTIAELFQKHIKQITPLGVSVEVKLGHGGTAYFMDTQSVAYQAASAAVEKTFGMKPYAKRDGGSIPITSLFESVLHCKSVLLGFGLESDALHAPNEHYGLSNFYKGIETIPYFYDFFVKLQK